MTVVQVAPGVWRVPTAPFDLVNCFLLEAADSSLTLVDVGLKSARPKVLAALSELGRSPRDVTSLVLSHAHTDHAGAAAGLLEQTGSRVYAHDDEAGFLREGRAPALDRSTWSGRLMSRLPTGGFAPVAVDETFTDGAVLPLAGGLQVVHTPGHTPGHCSFLHPSSGVLLTGDAVFNVRGLRWSLASGCTDVRLSRASARRLGELDYDVAGFMHGPHVATRARQSVRAFVAGRPS